MHIVHILIPLALHALFTHAHPTSNYDKHEIAKRAEKCDKGDKANDLNQFGVAYQWQTSQGPNYYLSPEMGACGYNYTDQSNAVCIDPGWIDQGLVNHCNAWVQVYLPETGITVDGIVWDSCVNGPDEPAFGCNDLYVSKSMFEKLAGKQRDAAVEAGQLPGAIQWRFTQQPCWGCYAGLPGIYPNGTQDSCTGEDTMGFTRCGRKSGNNRIVGPNVSQVCNQDVQTCTRADSLCTSIPKARPDQTGL